MKLLRVLQDRTFEVLGSSQRRTVDVRVVAATNRNLAEMVSRGEFREDLLYRINLITLHLPPLRERRDDIPVLASRFLQAVGQVYRREDVRLSADALAWLKNQPWPGNVRQLQQGIERTVLVTDKPVLDAADFQATSEMEPREAERDVAAAGRQHDHGRTGKGDDRQVAQAPQRQHLQGRAGAGPQPRRLVPALREIRDRRVSLRTRFVAYLVVVHLLMAGVAWFVVVQNRFYLIAVEAVLALSFVTGLALTRRFFESLEFVRQSAQLLEDSDFMSRVREVKQADVDRLIQVYNRMVDALRGERVQLQEQQHFLARVLRESPGGIVVLDFDGRVTLANPAAERLLQAPGETLTGSALATLDRALAHDLLALAPGDRRVIAVWGGRRVRALHGTFLDRGFRRSFFLLEELTEELRHSEKAAYEKLIRMLSHEVNNTVGASNSLLNSCLTYGVQLHPHDRADFEHALAVVIARTEQLSGFMASFADVVRLPAPQLDQVEPAVVVDGLLALVRAQAETRRIAVVRQGLPSVGTVRLDRGQMEQALLNVMKNGLEAIGHDGTLTVRVLRRDAVPVIEIEDSGPGLSDEVRTHLFTPFFSTKENGQGIGLTMVQEILAGHGFPFALEGPAGGPTTFTVMLTDRAPSAR